MLPDRVGTQLPAGSAKRLLINAASVRSEGGRVVLEALMRSIARRAPPAWTVEVVVRNASMLPQAPHIIYHDLRQERPGWLGRAYLELFGLKRMWHDRPVDVFLSMQGANATVPARTKFVYCHNALGFTFPAVTELIRIPRPALIQLAYALTYRFGIGTRATVIVQQEWQRAFFRDVLGMPECLVAHPVDGAEPTPARNDYRNAQPLRILYPTSPLPHKNTELLCEAVTLLANNSPGAVRLTLTLLGTENALARSLKQRFANVAEIEFVGKLSRQQLEAAYDEAQLLVFPSRVETWGLPLTEARHHGLGILAADLPYAHEAIGEYDAADFFDPADAPALAARIRDAWTGKRPLRAVGAPAPQEPFAPHWDALVDRIFVEP